MAIASVQNGINAAYEYGESMVKGAINYHTAIGRSVEEWSDKNLSESVARVVKGIFHSSPVALAYAFVLPSITVLVAPATFYAATRLLSKLPYENRFRSLYVNFCYGSAVNTFCHFVRDCLQARRTPTALNIAAATIGCLLTMFWVNQANRLQAAALQAPNLVPNQASDPAPAQAPAAAPAAASDSISTN
jgi:hypothetical protein